MDTDEGASGWKGSIGKGTVEPMHEETTMAEKGVQGHAKQWNGWVTELKNRTGVTGLEKIRRGMRPQLRSVAPSLQGFVNT